MGDGFERVRSADLYAHRLLDRMAGIGAARRSESTPEQRVLSGAGAGWGAGLVDADLAGGFRPLGQRGTREVPELTRERARMDSHASYRTNPMARAILDTYVSFCVGDSGLTLQCTSDEVRPYAEKFWADPKVDLGPDGQELFLRSKLLNGEQVQEMIVGDMTGVCRRKPIDPARIADVALLDDNPLWPLELVLKASSVGSGRQTISVIQVNDYTELREGTAFFWPMFRATEMDRRGTPLLMPILDWLDSYDQVLSNLIDRTALARYLVWDVEVDGDKDAVDEEAAKIAKNGIPRSGGVNVHNNKIKWTPQSVQTGSYEDANTNQSVLTMVSAGGGVPKHWLSEPENANRATALTMAEPIRRRLDSVKTANCEHQVEMVRYQIDQRVRVGLLPMTVTVTDQNGVERQMSPADTVTVTGPEIAASDAEINAKVLLSLAQSLEPLVTRLKVMSPEMARLAVQKAWEDYTGRPLPAELAAPDAKPDDIATHIDETGGSLPLAVGAVA